MSPLVTPPWTTFPRAPDPTRWGDDRGLRCRVPDRRRPPAVAVRPGAPPRLPPLHGAARSRAPPGRRDRREHRRSPSPGPAARRRLASRSAPAPHEQTGAEVYSGNDLDRGHLVRRRDPGWGDADQARAAMRATFAYPNAAPQAAGFNQSPLLWLGLEDHVLRYAEATAQRVSVFTAPILADDDPAYRGIRVPLRFWKIAAWSGPTGLASAGFVLDQSDLVDTTDARIAPPALGAFRTFQVPVGDIAALAGLDAGPLSDADVLTRTTTRPPSWHPLSDVRDIRL
ncbi:DNA/RNA non-specific endonuclease [Microbacterium resistens]|uniref:DNA/RNA non-specific endonuclease n=1 Tax=Microbacterium resistens TaxID=156977 RepID=UPI00366E9D48